MQRKLQCLQMALVYRKGPILLYDNTQLHVAQLMLQKLNKLGYEVLSHLPHSADLLPTDYHFFKHLNDFLQGKHFHNQQEAENIFQEFCWILKQGFSWYRNKQTFLFGKNVLIVMVSILINKNVFESSYNNLKCKVWNCDYFCTHIICIYYMHSLYIYLCVCVYYILLFNKRAHVKKINHINLQRKCNPITMWFYSENIHRHILVNIC